MLNITPSAVAQQIRTLEREIGAPLIVRVGRTVSMTEEGARILQRARDLLRDVADLRSVANDDAISRRTAPRRVHHGAYGDAARDPRAHGRRVPGHQRVHQAGLFGAALRAVESRRARRRVRAAGAVPLPKTCDWQLLREEPLIVLAPRAGGSRPARSAGNEPLIRYDRNQWGGRQADEYLRDRHPPRERFELNALNAIAVMVDRGLGVSLVPDWARPVAGGHEARAPAAADRLGPRRIGIVWSRSSVRMRLVTVFLQESRR